MIELRERFNQKWMPVTESGCWLWIASKNARGYGQIQVHKRRDPEKKRRGPELAHRLSWRLNRCEIPPETHVLHKCDTPACVNPDHLFLGTDKDNVADMIQKGRNNTTCQPKGEDHWKSKLSSETALEIFHSSDTQKAIAERFGVCKATVCHIKSGRLWSHLTGKKKPEKKIKCRPS